MYNKNNKSTTNVCGNKSNNDRNYKIITKTIMIIIVIIIINNSDL